MNAVIYCRVSSKEQVEGTSLESQEQACREYATHHRMSVVRVFTDRGESAKFADRPQLLELLAFCGHRNNAIGALLVWKVDRLARNVGDHFSIKAALRKSEVQVVSVTEPIDANPEGRLLETMLAGFAQFDNDIRAARSIQGMKHKLQEGLFPWKAPLGYKSSTRGEKKTQPDVPDEPAFGLLQRAWNEFATGNFSKAEILRSLGARGLRTTSGNKLSAQSLDNILRDPFYAGILRDPWTNAEFPGRHIPMVGREIFDAVQRIIERYNRSVPHLSLRPDLPLRSFVRCACCEQTLTGSFSRGRSRSYPYYHCWSRACESPGRYPAAESHLQFVEFLEDNTPTRNEVAKIKRSILTLASNEEAIQHAVDQRRKREGNRLKEQEQQLIRMKMDQLISDDEFISTRSVLRSRLAELESGDEEAPHSGEELRGSLDEICEPLMDLGAVWQEASIENRIRFQRWALPTGFVYGRIGTAPRGRLFSLFRGSERMNSNEVPLTGETWNHLAEDIKLFGSIVITPGGSSA